MCKAGKCLGAIKCNDGNPCTDDACGSDGKCAATPNGATCDDGNQCTVGDACKLGACTPVSVTVCNDATPCTDDYCDAAKPGGCATTANTAECTIAGGCTAFDQCAASKCTPGSKLRYFEKQLGVAGLNERAYGIAALPDGGAVLVGASANAYKSQGGLSDTAIWRVSKAGDVVWEKVESLSSDDMAHTAALAPDGKLLVAGFGLNGFGMWLAKYDGGGKKEWIGKTDDGGYPTASAIVTRTVVGGPQHVVCGIYWDGSNAYARLAYFNEKGGFMLATKWNGGPANSVHGGHMECRDIVSPGDGTLMWAGWTNDVVGSNPFAFADRNAIIVPVDTGWGVYDKNTVARFGGTGDDAFYALAAVKGPVPGWFGAGYTASKGAGKQDAWLVRLDAGLKVVWDATLGEGGDDQFWQVRALPDGGAVAVGSFVASGPTLPFLLIARYSAAGTKVWHTGGGSGGDYHERFDVALTGDNDLLVAGVFAPKGSKDQAVFQRMAPFGQAACTVCGKLDYATCDDGDYCSNDTCDAGDGTCTHVAMAGLTCTDDNACTASDACSNGACVPGATVLCDDKNPCTTETCDKVKGCSYTTMKDGVECGSGLVCKVGKCGVM
ncbi:MAG: hypothetical protein EXR79_17840 [Myxococcales bacterium]|nr:hypothetical protein [Myxococcales bacterium]